MARARYKAVTVVVRLNNITMVDQAVKQCNGQFGSPNTNYGSPLLAESLRPTSPQERFFSVVTSCITRQIS